MMKNLGKKIKKMQEMQTRLQELNEEMEHKTFSASVGGGAVKVEVTGKGVVTSLNISEDICSPDEADTLQELIILAVNTAKSEAETAHKQALQELTGGLPLPPGLSLPF